MTLPKSCEVEALAEWQSEIWDANSSGPALAADLALGAAIRALLEAKVREACLYAAGEYDVDALREDVDSIVSHAMGAK